MEISDSSGVPSGVPRESSQRQFSLRRRVDLIAGHFKLFSIKDGTAFEAPGMLSTTSYPMRYHAAEEREEAVHLM
ncbi:hypothetical protein GJ744_003490 [Endocarpon pusillum]|uniref:Uncharacterized protein n=1 Tax=Endocarpon pusillum TaxID=364733 RepID=A0A8H7AQM6_9EURO|nr:hypothetical protein GJ744_003490 [Endocarpon pusillum]